MTCHICGGDMEATNSDMPFNVDATHIVIFKGLPNYQCSQCGEYLIDDAVMERVEAVLSRSDSAAELEVVRYAA